VLGQALQQQGRQPEAVDALRQAIERAPSSVEAHLAISRSLVGLGQRAQAVEHQRRALASYTAAAARVGTAPIRGAADLGV
jgi:tetratricopeptide (TPR) repeat protein